MTIIATFAPSPHEMDPLKDLHRKDCFVVMLNGREMAAFTHTIEGLRLAIHRWDQLTQDYPQAQTSIINPYQSDPDNPSGLTKMEQWIVDNYDGTHAD